MVRPRGAAAVAANPLPDNHQPMTIGGNRGIAPRNAVGPLERIGRGAAAALSIGDWREAGEPNYRRIESETELELAADLLDRRPSLCRKTRAACSSEYRFRFMALPVLLSSRVPEKNPL